MFYHKNSAQSLDPKLFASPSSEYRGTPFWAWNTEIRTETLNQQIEQLKQMGMGGFHMHVRTGMASPYLTDEFMDHISTCVKKAREEGMYAWLYDEDRWPSGAAGGLVTKDRQYAQRYLLITPTPYGALLNHRGASLTDSSGHGGTREENGALLAVYDILLDRDGALAEYRRIDSEQEAAGDKWYVYAEIAAPSSWINNEPYLDTLNPRATEKFIEVTHERYAARFQRDFGSIIPAIFTDEPQFSGKGTLAFPTEKKDVFMTWTDALPALYRDAYAADLLDVLPELIWELPKGQASVHRYRFHDLVTEQFCRAFLDPIGDWCRDHGLMLGGHLMEEPTLKSQTRVIGDAMRGYRAFRDMPGVDLLCDFHEYNTLKQAQSALHQQGGQAMLSELYGVTGWDFDFRGHKLQGDWQAALGVTVRVPHLTWMSMKGEAKRDYPASIGYQSPWFDQYSMVEDHFARLNTALTRGVPEVKVAVVHPIESYWLHWGPDQQTAGGRAQLEKNFASLTETLLFNLIDFDFLCEARLPELCGASASAPLKVGAMAYDTVIVPPLHTIRETTLTLLEGFVSAGGRLIVLGDAPALVDALLSDRPEAVFARAERLPFDEARLIDALDAARRLDIYTENGTRTDILIHQLRRDNDGEWLFICRGKNPVSNDVDPAPRLRFVLKGRYALEEYDTLTGEIRPLGAGFDGENTVFHRDWHLHDSLLLRLIPGEPLQVKTPAKEHKREGVQIPRKVPVKLSEPNMLLLDMAEYALDGGNFHPEEEILRLDNLCRAEAGLPSRRKHVVQPYLIRPEEPRHFITLRMMIPSEIDVLKPLLALEEARDAQITFNGERVPSEVVGWYVDEGIETVKLPPIRQGDNELIVRFPLAARTNLEAMYLLGDFGVRVEGRIKTVTPPVRALAFGSFTHQGLPFYTGNVTYEFDVEVEDGTLTLRASQYRGALIGVDIDGQRRGRIAFAPYTFAVDGLTPGRHTVGLTLYGTRQNGFGQVHHTQGVYFYQSPDSWRTEGDLWAYEYQLRPFGILRSPEIFPGWQRA